MDAITDFVGLTADDLATVTAQQVTSAKLVYVDRQIARYGPGAAPDDLVAVRSDLVADASRFHFFQRDLFSDRFGDHMHPIVLDWFPIQVPVLSPGIQETPGTPGTSGAIEAYLGHGSLSIFADLRNPGPQVESWVSNWSTAVVFPPAPETGLLSYRFSLDGVLSPYLPSVSSGGLWGTVTLAVSGDVGTPLNWSKPAGSYWPVDATLPFSQGGGTGYESNDLNVSGQIPVHTGKQAVLGMVFVVIVSIAHGQVTLFPTAASLGIHYLGEGLGPTTTGRIEYRFEPTWLGKVRDDVATLNRRLYP
jgi:hypothetical protein